VLATVFDLMPGLSAIPLAPTVLHILAVILGVRESSGSATYAQAKRKIQLVSGAGLAALALATVAQLNFMDSTLRSNKPAVASAPPTPSLPRPPQAMPAAITPAAFRGRWEGSGTQGGSTWPIVLTVEEETWHVEYPSLNCRGPLTPVASSNQQIRLREELEPNQGRCVDRGTVELRRIDAGTIDFKWYYPAGQLGARGTLLRALN
jgi:hypothetical protein